MSLLSKVPTGTMRTQSFFYNRKINKNLSKLKLVLRRKQLKFLLYGQSEELFRVGLSTKLIISFTAVTSKNKNIDHRVKETYAIDSTHVTYGTDHVSLLRDSTMSSALNCFSCILL